MCCARLPVGEFPPARLLTALPEPFPYGPVRFAKSRRKSGPPRNSTMNGIIYLVGLIVVIMFILSLLGLR
jgi:hypothetical protein